MEHAWQLVQAAQLLGADSPVGQKCLDAMERTLQQRLWFWKKTGQVASLVQGWEIATGRIQDTQDIYSHLPSAGRPRWARDYREGRLLLGSSPPEGLAYFSEVLRFYLQHRPASRLTAQPDPRSPLGQMLANVPAVEIQGSVSAMICPYLLSGWQTD